MEQFFCKTKIISGQDALQILPTLHIKRLFIVADPFFYENGIVNHIAHLSNAQEVAVFHKITPDPSVALAAEGTRMVQEFAPDTLLALGGGSAMDCAKAMVYFSGLSLHFIAVPTTSGSGSEVTDFAILTHDGVKHPLVDPILQPDMAILAGNLLDSLPKKLIAETGFDLISQKMGQNGGGMFHDDGADAVAVHDTDGNGLLGGKVSLFADHIGNALLLLFQNLAEGLAGHINVHHYCPPSLV